ncbi:MAG TPA: hypothetical protein VJ785_07750, partial [Anaerolineales bacterium]|nr:hypothetical protein [Anaerolineales bacterium]
MKHPLRLAFIFLILVSLSCSLPQYAQSGSPPLVFVTAGANGTPTLTPFQPVMPGTETPTLAFTFTSVPPTDTPLPTLEFTATRLAPPTSIPASARTQYSMYVLLDYHAHQMGVDETIRYTNRTGAALKELVLAVEPNLREGFSIENMMLDGTQLNYDLGGQRLTVYLPYTL